MMARMPTPPRWLTVPMAADDMEVSEDVVYRHIRNTTPEQVPRRKLRLANRDGKKRLTLVVDVNALREFAEPHN